VTCSARSRVSTSALPLGPGSRRAVRNYAAINRWLDPRDLEQEAAVVALEAARTWEPDGGTSRDLWEAWKVGLALSRFVAEQRVPVSLPKYKGESWHEAASALRECLEVGLPGGVGENPELARLAVESYEAPENVVDMRRELDAIRRLLDEAEPAARAVLLEEEKSSVVADRMGIPTREVYDRTRRAIVVLRSAFFDRRADR